MSPGVPVAVALGCVACGQQAAGSEFLQKLNEGDETPGPVDYTVVQTRNDEVVVPFTSAFLEKGPRVTNVLLQDNCPQNNAEHIGIIFDEVAIQLMLNALGRPGPGDPAFKPDCTGRALDSFPDSFSVAPAKLRVGKISRVSRATADRVLRVGLGSDQTPVEKVRVTLHQGSSKGPILGQSKTGNLRGTRKVVLRLKRMLGPGRYVAVAEGIDATGRRASGQRAFRLR